MRHLLYLSKLMEECGEVIQIASKCLIHGEANTDPDTGEINLVRLREEMEDVMAIFSIITTEYELDAQHMVDNLPTKIEKIEAMVDTALQEEDESGKDLAAYTDAVLDTIAS